MRQEVFLKVELDIRRSENYSLSPGARSGIRHSLVERAVQVNDLDVWKIVGDALIRAAEVDDLVPKVSDKFCQGCPDSVFATFSIDNAACRFREWDRRTLRAHGLRRQ